jgi:hypothetical protein
MFAGLQQLPDLHSCGIGGSLGVCDRIKPGENEKKGQDFHWAKIGNSCHLFAPESGVNVLNPSPLAVKENETGYLPPLKTKIESTGSYDVVFVCFPTWDEDAAAGEEFFKTV